MRVWKAQPADKSGEVSHIEICPGELLITQKFPKQLEMVGCGADRVRRAPKVIKKFEKRQDGSNGQVMIIKH